jgi:hypothetical protein
MKNACLSVAFLSCAAVLNVGSAQTHPATIPSGTAVRVRTVDPISVESAQPGSKFRGTLADPIKDSAGTVLLPRGAAVQLSAVNVKKSNRISGRDKIDLKLDSISFGGIEYPVVTSIAESKGRGMGKRTLTGTGIGAGAGALIGGIAGGGTGAAVGAAVGGGGGTAVAAATNGKHLTIPPESVLSFQLHSPLRIH